MAKERHLTETKLKSLTDKKDITEIKKLNLLAHGFSDVSILHRCVNLVSLSLHTNYIKDISWLSSLTNLKDFYATSNEVDLSDILSLPVLPSIQYLSFKKNPCQSHESYKEVIASKFPNLIELDGEKLSFSPKKSPLPKSLSFFKNPQNLTDDNETFYTPILSTIVLLLPSLNEQELQNLKSEITKINNA